MLKFGPTEAKELWAQADKIMPYEASKPLQIASNTDGGNKEWIEAVINGFKNILGVQSEIQPFARFAEVLDLLLREGLAARETNAASAKFNNAQEILFQELPGLLFPVLCGRRLL